MVFKACANDLPFVIEIFRSDKADHAVYQKGIERSGHAVGPRFQRYLVHAMMRLRGKSAALAGFEVHHVFAGPWHIAPAVMLENAFASLRQHRERDAKTSIRAFGPGDGLK